MNKIPTVSDITRRLPAILLLIVLFHAQTNAQSFESAFESDPVYQWITVGGGPSAISSDRSVPGLSKEATPFLLVLEGQFPGTRFGFSWGTHQSDSGNSTYLSGQGSLLLGVYRMTRQPVTLAIPVEVSSRFSSWKRKSDTPDNRLNGSSLELVTGLQVQKHFDSFQLSGDWQISGGLAFQELTDYNGTITATAGRLQVALPELYNDYGVIFGLVGSLEKWNFESNPGQFTEWKAGINAGVCW